MTSDRTSKLLEGFFRQWAKYWKGESNIVVCGYKKPEGLGLPSKTVDFYSIGDMRDYPVDRWSDSFIKVLDEVAEEVFIFFMDDYYLIRQVDLKAIEIIRDYMLQFTNVIRFDLTTDRLYADPGKYVYGYNTYNTVGHLDLIKSDFHSPYHMSLWSAMWRRDLLRKILVPGETAQQIELNGTNRLSQYGDELLVLGTRQSPLRHANVIQGGTWSANELVGVPALSLSDRQELELEGVT